MLKIKDSINLKELEKYGFKEDSEHDFYYKTLSDCEIFIYRKKKKEYKYRYIYLEVQMYSPIIVNLDILHDLIEAKLVEKVQDEC